MYPPQCVRLIPVLCLALLAATAFAQTDPVSVPPEVAQPAQEVPQPQDAPAEQVLVVGQKPGPGLWKVSKDGHVMWVFGIYGPLPKNMEWRSREVESIIAQSQEFITEPAATLGVGYLRGLTLLPFMIGFEKSPDGKTLHDLLPEATHERWLALRKKYLKDDDSFERKRPLFAASELAQKAMSAAGLAGGKAVREKLEAVAKQHKLKVTSTAVELELDSPIKAVRDFKKTPLEDVGCFTKTIERLETDMDALRARANAWAKGDIAAIRALDFSEQEASCLNAVQNSAVMKERGMGDIDSRMRNAWLAAAEKSLGANQSTFAVLQIKHILGKQGYLGALEAKGYTVEQPD